MNIKTWQERLDGKPDIYREDTMEEIAMLAEIEELREALASAYEKRSNDPSPALLRRIADALVVGILTGHDWPNDQKELTRLQAAELLRIFAARIEIDKSA